MYEIILVICSFVGWKWDDSDECEGFSYGAHYTGRQKAAYMNMLYLSMFFI